MHNYYAVSGHEDTVILYLACISRATEQHRRFVFRCVLLITLHAFVNIVAFPITDGN